MNNYDNIVIVHLKNDNYSPKPLSRIMIIEADYLVGKEER